MQQATPLTLLHFPSSPSVVTAGPTLGPTDWFPYLATRHIQGVVCLSQNVSVAEREVEWGYNEGSFSLMNTVTQLPVK